METLAPQIDTENYRDHLSNVTSNGGRIRIFPRIISGQFYRWRSWVSYILILAMFSGPFLSWNGHPLFLFNVLGRKFILFGVPFFPQDFNILALALLTFIVFIVVFTVAFGRVWCGWACPQTIFMEMIFRKIENWIEGDAAAQRKLQSAPWDTSKWLKKTAKHTVFFLISFAIANIFLAYLIGKDDLVKLVTEGPIIHWGKLLSLLVFTLVFYFVFAKFRELACIYVCPYGRLQSVLVDSNSMAVSYDHIRGEPRGKRKANEAIGTHGDCVDCKICVHVCPTGIDIRNGNQLECIGCTACIDACNFVMEKTHQPKGLIRYASKAQIETNQSFSFTKRMVAYSTVLVLLAGFFSYILITRPEMETTILRAPGMLFQENKNGMLTNLYNFELVNKTFTDTDIEFKVKNPHAKIVMVGSDRHVPKEEMLKGAFFIEMDPKYITSPKTTIEIEVMAHNKSIETVKTAFMGRPAY